MKLNKISFLLLLLAVSFPGSISLLAQDVSKNKNQLTEPAEIRTNQVQPPELVMDILGIRPGMIIGEVGAGNGRLTVHLAARVGAKGKVYANDIDPEAINYLKARCQRQGIRNIETILSLPDNALFPQNSLDVAVMAYVYHHITDPVPLLKSILPSLKPWGIIALAEPKPENIESNARRLTPETVREQALQAGFTLDAVIENRLQADNIYILRPTVPDLPESHDSGKVRALWLDFLDWGRTNNSGLSLRDYAINLNAKGIAGTEIRRRMQVIRDQFTQQPEGIEMIYDPLYGKPLTGDMEKDGFKTTPNAFLVEAVKNIKAGGQALDVGAGMGRNAIYLARLGWDVTGIDLSSKGLAVMQTDADKEGLTVHTIKTSYVDFNFGNQKWDLIAMILSWAPVEEPDFLDRLKKSVRPGGYIIFEHVIQRTEDPFPPGVHALAPGKLRELFSDFEILIYREVNDFGDWGGPATPHVRMLARKSIPDAE
jgi:2-polyprenyl-3-methyl-5-hydroxy-6-metoxy-1,4-benzoquinol methylase